MVMICINGRVDPSDSAQQRCLTFPMHRTAMVEACVEIVRRLGDVAEVLLEEFRIEFSDSNAGNPNIETVSVVVHFTDPLGNKDQHSTRFDIGPHCVPQLDYRVIASRMLDKYGLGEQMRDCVRRAGTGKKVVSGA